MPTRLSGIVSHWPLKLASLALAIVLWAVVSAEQVTMHWIPVRVEAEVRDPRYVLTAGPGPAEVRVLFAGPGRVLWQLAFDRPTLVLPIRGNVNRRGYAVDAQMIRIPEGIRGVVIREIRPAVVRVEVQSLATREVPVRARFSARSLDRFAVGADLRITPAAVRVTGPARDLESLVALETLPIDLTGRDSAAFDLHAAIDTGGLREFILSESSVRVRGEADRRTERVMSGVAVRSAAGDLLGTADLRLSGPSRTLEALEPSRVRLEETAAGARIVGLPVSVHAVVQARRAPPVDSAPAPPP